MEITLFLMRESLITRILIFVIIFLSLIYEGNNENGSPSLALLIQAELKTGGGPSLMWNNCSNHNSVCLIGKKNDS